MCIPQYVYFFFRNQLATFSAANLGETNSIDAAQEELEMLEGELSSVQELRFAFKRAASRLTEMAGEGYRKSWAEKRAKKASTIR